MKAVITGASSGIGREMAIELSKMGYDIVAVARRKERLDELKNELKTNVEIVCLDVRDVSQLEKLAMYAKESDILINNAGFGVFGKFTETSLSKELDMLDTNVRAMHILTKLFLDEYKRKDSGYILNVSSLASFFPGPLFGAYYASKSYVLRLTQAISEELRRDKSHVSVSALCPGPIHTEFGSIAGVNFGNGTEKLGKLVVLNAKDVAKYAIKCMFKKKTVIIPGFVMKTAVFLRHLLSDKLLSRAVYLIQSKKCMIK